MSVNVNGILGRSPNQTEIKKRGRFTPPFLVAETE